MSFDAPFWLLGLVAPVMYLALIRQLARPVVREVGSLALWRKLASTEGGVQMRGRLTWRHVAVFLGLVSLVLGMAQPVLEGQRVDRVWTLVLGTGAAGDLTNGDSTRLATAISKGRAFAGGESVQWLSADGVTTVSALGADFIEQLRAAGERDWAGFDRGDCVWLPVSGAGPLPVRAGLRRGAFEDSSGAVARIGDKDWGWDGQVAELAAGGRARVLVDGLGETMQTMVAAWTGERGDVVEGQLDGRAVLRVFGPGDGGPEGRLVDLGVGGWTAEVELVEFEFSPGLTPALSLDGQPVICVGPGRVELGFVGLDRPGGDPAAFAVWWAQLFDDAALAPEGLVAVESRLGCEALSQEPVLQPGRLERAQTWIGAWLALLAAGLLLAGTRFGAG